MPIGKKAYPCVRMGNRFEQTHVVCDQPSHSDQSHSALVARLTCHNQNCVFSYCLAMKYDGLAQRFTGLREERKVSSRMKEEHALAGPDAPLLQVIEQPRHRFPRVGVVQEDPFLQRH